MRTPCSVLKMDRRSFSRDHCFWRGRPSSKKARTSGPRNKITTRKRGSTRAGSRPSSRNPRRVTRENCEKETGAS